MHFLSNAMSLAPEFKIILLSCETERDFKGKVIAITFGGWGQKGRRGLAWSQTKAG